MQVRREMEKGRIRAERERERGRLFAYDIGSNDVRHIQLSMPLTLNLMPFFDAAFDVFDIYFQREARNPFYN